MPTLNHTHTYIKYKKNPYKNRNLYKCNDPDCTHFADMGLIIGKRSLCPLCSKDFILTTANLKLSRPRCVECSNTAAGREKRRLKELVGILLPNELTEGEIDG